MENIILHIDVNNAFLSWSAIHLLNNGHKEDIRNINAIIGGDEEQRHGVVLAKSNSAKKYGVVTGEPIYQARKKCPALKLFPPNYNVYQEMSNKLFNYLSQYTNEIERFSIDECFINYTNIKHLYGDEIEFAIKVKEEIKKELGFTVNIGIANNKLGAKMASDFEKPDKIHTLYQQEVKTKMWPLPIGDLYGVGRKTKVKLLELNINTIGDLANYDKKKLNNLFKTQGLELWNSAWCIDDSKVDSMEIANKCISNSTTLAKNILGKEEAHAIIMSLAENVGLELRNQHKYAYVIAIQIRDKYFHNYSHQKKLDNPTNLTKEIYKWGTYLFDNIWDGEPVRLIGLRIDKFSDNNPHQLSLFEEVKTQNDDSTLQTTIDKLKNKYGSKIISNAITKEKAVKKKYQK